MRHLISFRRPGRDRPARSLTFQQIAARRVGPAPIADVESCLRDIGFDPVAYRDASLDLVAAGLDENGSFAHFLAFAGTERRLYPLDLDIDGLPALLRLPMPSHVCASLLSSLLQACFDPRGRFWRNSREEGTAFWRRLLDSCGASFDFCVLAGDSHSNLYIGEIEPAPRPLVVVHILCSGCSALGLANPTSRSGANERLKALAATLPPAIPIFSKFGQVDIEFVFNFQRIRDGRLRFDPAELAAFCRRSVSAYTDFLAETFGPNAAVISVFPPTLSDRSWREGYVNAHVVANESSQALEEVARGVRLLEIPSLGERTQHHALYNEELRRAAASRNLGFVSDFEPFLGRGGVVDFRFIPDSRGSDHHLEPKPSYPLLRNLLVNSVKARSARRHALA